MFNRQKEISSWVLRYSEDLTGVLKERRSQALLHTTFPELFDSDTRTLSEMHLCGANGVILPNGYTSVHGTVSLGKYVYEHTFGLNRPRKEIYDLFVGQFFVRSEMKRGEAISSLVVLAPALFTIIGEVAVLHGRVDNIRDKLGIQYLV